ncbi:MAG: amidohydrolase family protein [Terriglobia bacterium]|jgi:N-acetylglucosamine-6-phosphate deacetylase
MQLEGNIPGVGCARVEITNEQISSVAITGATSAGLPFISPGFVDIQVNGFAGVDFSSPDLDVDKAISVLPAIWSSGVTTFCPTLITNSLSMLARNFAILEQAARMNRDFADAAPCYHLEGPYLSPLGSHGAHDPKWMRHPDWEEFLELQRAAGGKIGIVTVAPELPGAEDFIRKAQTAGVVVAIGHTDGRPEDVHRAAAAGATLNTHLGNGCPEYLHRHKAPLWAQLATESLNASLICDGFHLPPDVVKVIVGVKGINKCILITDAVHVALLPPGKYTLVGTQIELLPSGQVVTANRVSMAGSALTMNRGVAVFIKFSHCTLASAIQAATANPANLLRRHKVCSQVAAGQPADLVLFRQEPETLKVETVFARGRCVYSA